MNIDSSTFSTRSAKRRRKTFERVVDAAYSLFSRYGFFETSMAAIAAEADVAVGTLYNLFENKEALYTELIEAKAETFHTRIITALSRTDSPRKRLEYALEEKLSLLREEADFIRFYLTANQASRVFADASLPAKVHEKLEDGIEAVASIIAQGIEEGTFKRRDPYRAAVHFQASSTALFLLHLEDPAHHPAEALLAEAKELLVATLVDSVKENGEQT
ncbi:MAG: TetR/AcrR family transcriptional regulator [Deltaproteobacteria bacterium]